MCQGNSRLLRLYLPRFPDAPLLRDVSPTPPYTHTTSLSWSAHYRYETPACQRSSRRTEAPEIACGRRHAAPREYTAFPSAAAPAPAVAIAPRAPGVIPYARLGKGLSWIGLETAGTKRGQSMAVAGGFGPPGNVGIVYIHRGMSILR